jgi:hypothetical protein
MRSLVALALSLVVLSASAGARAETEVDMQLVLAVDVSRSMPPLALEIQRRGYAEALTSPEVLRAIGSGFLGRFSIPVRDWSDVAGAVRRKMVLEIAGLPLLGQAQAVRQGGGAYDCLIGEKLWQRGRGRDMP